MSLLSAAKQFNSPRQRPTPKGEQGYDNPRENIDPRIITNAVISREITGNKLNISNGTLYVNNGKVGINTTNPLEALHVEDGSTARIILASDTDSKYRQTFEVVQGNRLAWDWGTEADTDAFFSIALGGGQNRIKTNNRDFNIYTTSDSNPAIYVKSSNGDVGIGTANPGYKLDISGVGMVKDLFYVDSPTAYGAQIIQGAGDGYQYSNFMLSNKGTGSDWKYWFFSHRQDVLNSFSVIYYDGAVYGRPMTILANGNFGISETTPLAKLETAGGTATDHNIRLHDTRGSTVMGTEQGSLEFSTNEGDFGTDAVAAKISMIQENANGWGTAMGLGFFTSDAIYGTVNKERMRIDRNGNLGIGMQYPECKLTLSGGTLAIRNNATFQTYTTGGQLTVSNGALIYKGSSGTVTTLAPA